MTSRGAAPSAPAHTPELESHRFDPGGKAKVPVPAPIMSEISTAYSGGAPGPHRVQTFPRRSGHAPL